MKFLTLGLLLFITSFSSGYSQNPEIKNIVFEGACIRGIAFAGVIQ